MRAPEFNPFILIASGLIFACGLAACEKTDSPKTVLDYYRQMPENLRVYVLKKVPGPGKVPPQDPDLPHIPGTPGWTTASKMGYAITPFVDEQKGSIAIGDLGTGAVLEITRVQLFRGKPGRDVLAHLVEYDSTGYENILRIFDEDWNDITGVALPGLNLASFLRTKYPAHHWRKFQKTFQDLYGRPGHLIHYRFGEDGRTIEARVNLSIFDGDFDTRPAFIIDDAFKVLTLKFNPDAGVFEIAGN